MTELEKIQYTKDFIDKLANGINPLDDTPIPENDIANHIRLSRCFFYVSDILRRVIENGGFEEKNIRAPRESKEKRVKKSSFMLTDEEKQSLVVSDIGMSVSEITNYLNSVIDRQAMSKIPATAINKWLFEMGFLELVERPNGKNKKLPTKEGLEIGLYTEEHEGAYGTYVSVLFSPSAQQFVYDNLDSIIAMRLSKSVPGENSFLPWTSAEEALLREMYESGVPIGRISQEFKRSIGGINARLVHLGLKK